MALPWDDRAATTPLPGELGFLLEAIEKEPVPDRLLQLAMQLQAVLVRERTRQPIEHEDRV